MTEMLVGVDFDNTVVSYDTVFHATAVQQRLVPDTVAVTKEAVRDHLRAAGREAEWTRLQGYVYGPGMRQATPFPGALEFFERCRNTAVTAMIISHRTRWPYLGDRHDLHASARQWLVDNGVLVQAHFELTKQAKLERIGAEGCTHFVDDLPEFLSEPEFPAGVERLLFDPHVAERDGSELAAAVRRVRSWDEISTLLVGA
jgi:hypothetical protein